MPKRPSILHLNFNEDIELGLEFISIDDHYTRTQKNLQVPHRASFYLIFWFKSGTPVHIVDFRSVAVMPDSFLFIRKHAVQFFDQHNAFKSSTLLFTDTFFCENEHDYQFLQSSPLFNNFISETNPKPVTGTKEMRSLWRFIQKEEEQQRDGVHTGLLRKSLYCFMLLAERAQAHEGENKRLQGVNADLFFQFINLLEEHFREEKAMAFYAERVFVSSKVLTHITQATVGKTPKQLINERVILEAKRMLVHSNDPIKTIGIRLGFDEPTNFNKFFKKHSGQTPAGFRESFFAFC